MRLGMLAVILATSLLSACVFPPLGDAWFEFKGVVSDPAGHPIKGAHLTIEVNGKPLESNGTAETDAMGRYSFDAGSCPCEFSFVLRAKATGFQPYELKLNGEQANALKVQNITLRPAQ